MTSLVIAAHPDDEILWLSSAMGSAKSIILCYGAPFGKPDVAARRAQAVSALGLANLVNLAIPESGTRLMVNWSAPRRTETGIAIEDAAGQARYDANFTRLVTQLRPHLAGAEKIFTHNPWGEYGHPEHIQLYRALQTLQPELGFTLLFSNYVAPLTWPLARQIGAAPSWADKFQAQPNLHLARMLRKTYLRHRVWTFSRLHRWPPTETFYTQPPGPRDAWRSLRGEPLLDISTLRPWRAPKSRPL